MDNQVLSPEEPKAVESVKAKAKARGQSASVEK